MEGLSLGLQCAWVCACVCVCIWTKGRLCQGPAHCSSYRNDIPTLAVSMRAYACVCVCICMMLSLEGKWLPCLARTPNPSSSLPEPHTHICTRTHTTTPHGPVLHTHTHRGLVVPALCSLIFMYEGKKMGVVISRLIRCVRKSKTERTCCHLPLLSSVFLSIFLSLISFRFPFFLNGSWSCFLPPFWFSRFLFIYKTKRVSAPSVTLRICDVIRYVHDPDGFSTDDLHDGWIEEVAEVACQLALFLTHTPALTHTYCCYFIHSHMNPFTVH